MTAKNRQGSAATQRDGTDSSADRLEDLHDQIALRLRFAQAAVWNDLLATFKPLGIRPQHFAALAIIGAQPGCKQLEVGSVLGISNSNIVALIDELVVEELVTREQNPDNRRSYALKLTRKGHDFFTLLDEAHKAHEARVSQHLSVDELASLKQLLAKLSHL